MSEWGRRIIRCEKLTLYASFIFAFIISYNMYRLGINNLDKQCWIQNKSFLSVGIRLRVTPPIIVWRGPMYHLTWAELNWVTWGHLTPLMLLWDNNQCCGSLTRWQSCRQQQQHWCCCFSRDKRSQRPFLLQTQEEATWLLLLYHLLEEDTFHPLNPLLIITFHHHNLDTFPLRIQNLHTIQQQQQ